MTNGRSRVALTVVLLLLPMTAIASVAGTEGRSVPVDRAPSETGSSTTMKAFPEGVIRVNGFGTRADLPADFFQQYPWVAGFAAIELWADLQPAESGPIDWSYLDRQVARANTDGKPVIFLIKTGGGASPATPGWLSGPPYDRPALAIPAGETSAVPWDPVINEKWLAISAQIAARYDSQPLVAGIYVSGVQSQYPEMIFVDSTAWSDNTRPPPDGIQAPHPPNNPAFDAPSGSVYSDAWMQVLAGMAGQFTQTWLLNMVDHVFNPDGPGRLSGPMTAVAAEIDLNYSTRATIGTANMGDTVDLTQTPYREIRASVRDAPIVYEIGFKKLSGTADDLYRALRDCRQVLGCRAAIVHAPTWNAAGNPDEARRAYEEFWATASVGGIAEQPDVARLPSAASSDRDYTTYIFGAVIASIVAAAGAAGWRMRRT
jgi:hypothetical protein